MTEPQRVQCPRCFGRGYLPESRKPSRHNPLGLGFYARTCPRCNGCGEVEPKRKGLKHGTINGTDS